MTHKEVADEATEVVGVPDEFPQVFLFADGVTKCDEYKPFQLYLGLGYAIPSGGGGGVLLNVESTYRIKDELAVGIRFEGAAMAKEIKQTIGGLEGTGSATLSGVGSYTLNGKYYFGDSEFRPYAGLGMGLFVLGNVSLSNDDFSLSGGGKFGFYPRIGFDFGHFNLNLDYNIIGKTKEEVEVTISGDGVEITSSSKSEVKNSYLGIRVSFFLFGGKKSKFN